MTQRLKRAGIRGTVLTALAALVASPAAAAPGDGSACLAPQNGSCAAIWNADVNGNYAVMTSSSWVVNRQTGVDAAGNPVWTQIAGGTGPAGGSPGSLTAGSTYELVVIGQGGGSIGSITGNGSLI